jgi:hypothetical protein
MGMSEVLCSLTTIKIKNATWQSKIIELKNLDINRFALFLTGIRGSERDYLIEKLRSLNKSYKISIPFVHATSDMNEDEYKLLIDEFGCEVFNLHPTRCYPLKKELSQELREKIYIENSTPTGELFDSDLENFAGLCLDISHLEDLRHYIDDNFQSILGLISKHKIGVNHISAVGNFAHSLSLGRPIRHKHIMNSLDEFKYLEKYDRNLFGKFIAIELDEDFKTQLAVKSHIEQLILQNKEVSTIAA